MGTPLEDEEIWYVKEDNVVSDKVPREARASAKALYEEFYLSYYQGDPDSSPRPDESFWVIEDIDCNVQAIPNWRLPEMQRLERGGESWLVFKHLLDNAAERQLPAILSAAQLGSAIF